MDKLTQERKRSNEETESGIYTAKKTFKNICKNKIGMQENDNDLFVIDVTGQASNDTNNRESDEDESDDSRSAGDNLFMVDTVGKDGGNEDSDTEYDSDDENCVIGKIIFINFRTCITYCYQRAAFRTCILPYFRHKSKARQLSASLHNKRWHRGTNGIMASVWYGIGNESSVKSLAVWFSLKQMACI